MNRLKEMWNDKDRRRGLIGTTLVHILLLFALFFLALRTPLPLPGEEGVEVNLGYDEQGYGDIQTESSPPEAQPIPPPQPVIQETPEPEPEIVEEEFITQDIEEAPMLEEEIVEEEPEEIFDEPEEEPEPEKEEVVEEIIQDEPEEKTVDSAFIAETEEIIEEEPVEEPKPVVNERALYPGTSKNKTGTNQGDSQGAGDKGKPQGYKDSDKYDGRGGEGNGPSYSLGGRGGKYIEKPTVTVKERGTVVVDIWVDRLGNVVDAQFRVKGSNVFDPEQKRMAVEAAFNSKFDEDPAAPEKQRGSITYTFIMMK